MPAIYSEIDPEADPAAEHVRFSQEKDAKAVEEEEDEEVGEAEAAAEEEAEGEEEDGVEEEEAAEGSDYDDYEDEEDDVVYQPEETEKPYALRQVDDETKMKDDSSRNDRKEFEMKSPEVSYRDRYTFSSQSHKVNFHTLVKHRVSAVLAWNDEEKGSDFSHYHLSYYEENDVNTKESVTSQLPVFVVDGLKPERLYVYEVRKEGNNNNILWRRSGAIDTSVKNSVV